MKKTVIWIGALVVGAILGLLGLDRINDLMDFIATVYVRLFQLLAVPTIVLAITTTLATLGSGPDAGRIFRHTISYTLLTTLVAAAVGLLLYVIIAPGNMQLPVADSELPIADSQLTYTDHLLSVIPNNIVKPFLEGNVLSLLILAAAIGIALSQIADTPQKKTVVNFLQGVQEVLFTLIRGLIVILPVGIVAFAAQLSAQLSAGVIADSLGKYVAVVLGGNLLQFFVVLPIFLLTRHLNPIRVMSKMTPAVLTALFTKSSAATLPVTMETAEKRLGIQPKVARFVLPICTTINMNGCAAFILVTSLFVMQQGGIELTWPTMLTWLLISVSLMSGINAPIAVLGIILPIYTIIDMVETAVNVWSDSCVCAMTDHDIKDRS